MAIKDENQDHGGASGSAIDSDSARADHIASDGSHLALTDENGACATQGKYAQTHPRPQAIGAVDSVGGNPVILGCVAFAMNIGDAIFKNHLIETGILMGAPIAGHQI